MPKTSPCPERLYTSQCGPHRKRLHGPALGKHLMPKECDFILEIFELKNLKKFVPLL